MTGAVLAVLDDPPRLLDPSAPLVRADDIGFTRGESVFETVRVAAGRAAFLDEHLARMQRSAERLDIALPGGWPSLVALALDAWHLPDGVLRLTCTKGAPDAEPVGMALLTPVPPEMVRARADGVTAVTLTLGVPAALRPEAPWLMGGVKSTSYAVNMASTRAALALGADEAIWVSVDGYVLEAPTSTVVWVSGGEVVTPSATGVGILPGTTLDGVRGQVELPVVERLGSVEELGAAAEVMLLSSVRGVVPVVRLDGRELGVGPVTEVLREAYERAVHRR